MNFNKGWAEYKLSLSINELEFDVTQDVEPEFELE